MAKLGQDVTFHTVLGDCTAKVIGHGDHGDDDHELIVWPGAEQRNGDTGLTADSNVRWSHEDDKPGGFTA